MRSLSIGLLLSLFISACSPSLRIQNQIKKDLQSHRYAQADLLVEKNKNDYGGRNIVLYYLDRGLLLHLAGRYRESNAFFEKADLEMDRLYTQSVATHLGALLTNDKLLPYEGEDFEKVLVPLFSALNYAMMGEWDEALVEARRVDARLNLLNDRHAKKNVYKSDALARYLSGLLYEARGEENDAFIAYRLAYEAFRDYQRDYRSPIPYRLGQDLLRLTDALHLEAESEFYKKAFSEAFSRRPMEQAQHAEEGTPQGELVVLAYSGRAPVKEEFFIHAPIPDGEGGIYLLRIVAPKFVAAKTQVNSVEVVLRRGRETSHLRLDLMEDISAIAIKNLEDRVGRMTVKAVARATSKYIATRAARREARARGGEPADFLVALLGNLYGLASEQADLRSWQSLPGRLYLGRISLPEGIWEAEVRYMSPGGGLAEVRRFSDIRIEGRKKTFLIAQSAY